ncbi:MULTISPECIES: hypothetical protein [unclassified Streptomyces]|uniref:hypothetical protein n=1 Tax=unclassified Streptomyces TaxID=2593676 RepID=UPI00278C0D97|nr:MULTISPECIES: hypothetical protein [unclassified Streptomyces]
MRPRGDRWRTFVGLHTDPPRQFTAQEIAVNTVIAAVVFGAMGLAIGSGARRRGRR